MVRHELKAPTTLREAFAEEIVDALELLKLFYWLSKNEIVCTETPSLTLSRRDSAPVGQHGEQDEFTRAFVTSNEYSYFLNKRLSSGLSQRLEGPLMSAKGDSPDTTALVSLLRSFPFLYSFRTRLLFFKLTSFSKNRSIYNYSKAFGDGSLKKLREDFTGRSIRRTKISVRRDCVVENGMKIMRDLGNDHGYLDYEFNEEKGTGQGPSLEFYALISQAIQ